MTSYEISGKIERVFPTQEIGSNGFKKRVMLIEPPGQEDRKYKNYVALTVTKDRCAEFDKFAVGETVKAKFFINSNVWKDRVFTELMLAKDGIQRTSVRYDMPPAPPPTDTGADVEQDDMPF